MKFISPEFLYALGFLAIPILIHLFNFRRYKTVYFPEVKFLKSVKQTTQSTSRLKHLLILLSRCLAIIAMVLAFAQPFFPATNVNENQGKKGVSIYIDNSFSMQAVAEKGSLIALAKERAYEIIKAYGASDKFHIVTNDFTSKNQRWLNQEQAILLLQEIELSPIFRTIKEVTSRINQLKNDEELVRSKYIISDLQKVSFNLSKLTDSSEYIVLPLQNQETNNIYLATSEYNTPYHLSKQNEELTLGFKSSNADETKSLKAQLFLNGKLKTPFTVDFETKDSVNSTLNYRNSQSESVLAKAVVVDYPIVFDDTLFFNYPIQKRINVLHLYENAGNSNLKALFENDSLINYQQSAINQIDYSALGNNALIILDELLTIPSGLKQELLKLTEKGNSIALFPNSKMNVTKLNDFLSSFNILGFNKKLEGEIQVSSINNDAALFESVFEEVPKNLVLPKVKEYFQLKRGTKQLSEETASYPNGDVFINKYKVGEGSFYVSSIGLNKDQSNFSNHALFVPILFNMALQAVNSPPLYYSLNEVLIQIPIVTDSESPFHLIGNGIDLIPKQNNIQNILQLNLGNSIKKAGHYDLTQDEKKVSSISLNYDRSESKLRYYTLDELSELAEIEGLNIKLIDSENANLANVISKIDKGEALWKYFIIFALLFLLIEIALLRLLK